jgi:branched-chain amino acid transport system substrate-binding protein
MKCLKGLITGLLLFGFLLSACASPTSQPQTTQAPTQVVAVQTEQPNSEPIKIGGTLGISGVFATSAAQYQATYNLWADKVNKEGGLLGRPVKLIIYDDESTPATAQTLYQRLISEDKVDLLLAPYATALGAAVAPMADANKMILWNGGFVGIEQQMNSNWIFATYTSQEPTATKVLFDMIDNLPTDKKPQRVGILTVQNAYTLKVRDGYQGQGGVINFLKERGLEIVVNEEYAKDVTDVSALVQQVKNANVDMLIVLSAPNDGGLMARTLTEQNVKPNIVCYCGSQVTSLPYWKDLLPAGNYAFSTVLGWPTDNYNGVKELAAQFKEKFNLDEMPAYGPVAYAILQVLEQAVKGTGSLDQEKLREYLLTHEFDTAVGPIKYDQHGEASYNYALVQFVDGKNSIVWPKDRATASPIIPPP